jgi:hypothetical protein
MRRWLALGAAVMLAACAQTDPSLQQQALEEALAMQRASLAGVGAAVPPPAETPAVLSAARPSPAGPPPNLAGELVGQTPEGLRRMLGEPRLRRQEDGAEIWHYQASQCHLDLFLYPDNAPRPVLRVAFAQARAAGAARRAESACLRDIARGASRTPTQGMTEQAAARV